MPSSDATASSRQVLIPQYPLRPVFLDRADLAAHGELDDALQEQLRASRCLVVICSPRSARSEHVDREVAYFKSLGRSVRILCLIVDGRPNVADSSDVSLQGSECFTPSLRFEVGADTKRLPIATQAAAADARREGDGIERAVLKIIAGLTGQQFDVLWRRQERDSARKRNIAIASLAGLVVTFGGLAWEARRQQLEAERREQVALARYLAARAPAVQAQMRKDKDALKLVLEAHVRSRNSKGEADAEVQAAIRQVLGQPFFNDILTETTPNKDEDPWPHQASDQWLGWGGSESELRVRFMRAGRLLMSPVMIPGPFEEALYDRRAGSMLAIHADGGLRVWHRHELSERQLSARWPEDLHAQAWIADRQAVLARDGRGCLDVVDVGRSVLSQRRCLARFPLHDLLVARSADGSVIALTSRTDRLVVLIDVTGAQPRAQTLMLNWLGDLPSSLAVDAKGNRLAFGTKAGRAAIWTRQDPGNLRFLGETMGGASTAITFADEERWLFVGSQNGYLTAWQLSDPWRSPMRLRGHEGMIDELHEVSDPMAVLSVPLNGPPRVWRLDAAAAEPWVPDLSRHQRFIWPPKLHALDFAPEGRSLVVAGDHGLLQVWNLAEPGQSPRVLSLGGPAVHIMAASFSRDGRWLTAGNTLGEVAVWPLMQPREGTEERRQLPQGTMAWSVSPLGELGWVAGTRAGSVARWSAQQPGIEISPALHSDLIRGIAVDVKRQTIITVSDDGRVLELPANTTTEPAIELVPPTNEDAAGAVAVSLDGRWLAIARLSGVSLFDRSVAPMKRMPLTDSGFTSSGLDFSPDGNKLAVGANDGVLRIWDTEYPQRAPVLIAAHDAAIRQVAFSPDGLLLATGGFDASVKVWSATPEALVAKACRLLVNRSLSSTAVVKTPGQPVWSRACIGDRH